MEHGSLVTEFLTHFCAQDIEALGALLAENFGMEGPLFRFHSREEYLASVSHDAKEERDFRILRMFEDGDEVMVLYRFTKPGVDTMMAQLFRFRDGLIAETVLVFDGRAFDEPGTAP